VTAVDDVPPIEDSGRRRATGEIVSALIDEVCSDCDGDISSTRMIAAIGGSVAVGKSTAAATLGPGVTVIGTDGFLFPNDELIRQGSLERKGEPDTYDEEALLRLIGRARTDAPTAEVPTYSHRTFDVVAPSTVALRPVVVIEGVNALQPRLAAAVDLAIYLDAPENLLLDWYVERFLHFIDEAEVDRRSFYARFVDLGPPGRRDMAEYVWDTINRPNLHRFVIPTKAAADVVVTLDGEHRVSGVERRTRRRRLDG
jgi:type I pantothenate kinase